MREAFKQIEVDRRIERERAKIDKAIHESSSRRAYVQGLLTRLRNPTSDVPVEKKPVRAKKPRARQTPKPATPVKTPVVPRLPVSVSSEDRAKRDAQGQLRSIQGNVGRDRLEVEAYDLGAKEEETALADLTRGMRDTYALSPEQSRADKERGLQESRLVAQARRKSLQMGAESNRDYAAKKNRAVKELGFLESSPRAVKPVKTTPVTPEMMARPATATSLRQAVTGRRTPAASAPGSRIPSAQGRPATASGKPSERSL
ncbi:hypothetical protein J8273_5728 [Carpediemonas membranifera]|uniref:Uncharacterized protein n=1 Tax=Carpediemonas membranifera TaxID=201153 RepID=A0A8J6BWZ4_9EUKA|nr:hypothetical protein J8273_5728 [Carpediemonas membranifera]|eukprot:KAG9392916.1 hypothetical protein J8273_5728 [Carpediemonas membranifera]